MHGGGGPGGRITLYDNITRICGLGPLGTGEYEAAKVRGCGERWASRVLRARVAASGAVGVSKVEERKIFQSACRDMIYSTFQTKQLFFSQHFLSRPFRLFRTSLFEAKVRTQG